MIQPPKSWDFELRAWVRDLRIMLFKLVEEFIKFVDFLIEIPRNKYDRAWWLWVWIVVLLMIVAYKVVIWLY